MPIYFHTEDISFSLKNSTRLKAWINRVIKSEHKKTGSINFIFCSDVYLLTLNRQYLKHDYYTDIITFDQSDNEEIISADIYISIDRVKENAIKNKVPTIGNRQLATATELHRVMIHGVLHLLGYDDRKSSLRKEMRIKENEYLELI